MLHVASSPFREIQALRQQLEDLARESGRREQALQSEIDNLRAAWSASDSRAPDGRGIEGRHPAGNLEAPSSRASSPQHPSAPNVAALTVPSDVPTPNVGATAGDSEWEPGEGHEEVGRHAGPEDDGNELDEQSMELATPLYPTILSLADDDFLIPSLPPTSTITHTSFGVEPSEVPLPISSESIDVNAPLIVFSPPPPPPPPMNPQQGHLGSVPTLLLDVDAEGGSEAPRILPDLLARVESVSLARVGAIEREVEEKKRELEERARELAEKDVVLDELRRTMTSTPRPHAPTSAS